MGSVSLLANLKYLRFRYPLLIENVAIAYKSYLMTFVYAILTYDNNAVETLSRKNKSNICINNAINDVANIIILYYILYYILYILYYIILYCIS